MPVTLVFGIAALLLALALRQVTLNRHLQGRLMFSAVLFAAYTAAIVARTWGQIPPAILTSLDLVSGLAAAFGVVTLIVALSLNRWRADGVSERFPSIVQDTIVIALFAIAAGVILGERIFATTAVGAVVIGFALQDTLGNFFAGLAIQIEKPFRVGDWVLIDSAEGMVSEITWRATKIRAKADYIVVVPNSVVAKANITNYCAPTRAMVLYVEVSASYDTPPNTVKAVILDALRAAGDLTAEREPEVLLLEFAESGILYRVRFWTADFGGAERAKDRVRSIVYYAFRRAGITIPYPVQVELSPEEGGLAAAPVGSSGEALTSASMFAALTDEERGALARVARPLLYAAGESIVRQGEPGRSLFVIAKGHARVVLDGVAGTVAKLGAGDVFGEMSMLTGEARTATVVAETDCDLLEIEAEGFRGLVLANPGLLEKVTGVTERRRFELDRHRETHPTAVGMLAAPQTLLARVRQFLRL